MADEEAVGVNTFTEVTEQGYGERLKQSCSGMAFGVVIFFVSFVVLVWNEGRTVRRARDIDEGRELVLNLNLTQVLGNESSRFNQQLVYITGDLSTPDMLMDPIFGVGASSAMTNDSNGNFTDVDDEDDENNSTTTASTPTTSPVVFVDQDAPLKLRRSVEMYQWIQSSTTRNEKRSHGKTLTITEYSYRMDWSSSLVNSDDFAQQNSTRVNPKSFPFQAETWVADPILLEKSIVLRDPLVDRLDWYEAVDPVSLTDVINDTSVERLDVYRSNGFFYSSPQHTTLSSANDPVVGDVRITFTQVPPDIISVIAAFDSASNSLDNYVTSGGRNLLLLERGTFTSEEIFQQADSENTTLAWILRFVGFFIMFVSILLVLQPIADAVDIIPFVGDFLQGGFENCLFPTVALIISLPLSLFTIGLAWLAYRPVWSVPILVVSIGLIVWLCLRTKNVMENTQGNSNGGGGGKEEEEEIVVSMPPPTNPGFNEGEGGFANALDDPVKY